MRALAMHGTASVLPDLPGQNDTLLPTDKSSLSGWRAALQEFAARESGQLIVASWRGGALIDDAVTNALGYWRMAPAAGSSIVKTMLRTRIAGEKEAGRTVTADEIRASATARPVELAGNWLSAAMLAELEAATPADVAPLRQVAVGAGEGKLPGSALWLRAEPGEDAAMAQAMAADIHAWAMTCAAG
ncbi:hypothetical protein [Sphingomonas lacunae]|nr:hypothetical protein [Sphingomonas lacunae]